MKFRHKTLLINKPAIGFIVQLCWTPYLRTKQPSRAEAHREHPQLAALPKHQQPFIFMILEAIATFFATKNFTYQHYEYVILEATATFFATKNFTHQFYEYVILEATATFFATKIFFFMILEAIATFFATKNFTHQHYEYVILEATATFFWH